MFVWSVRVIANWALTTNRYGCQSCAWSAKQTKVVFTHVTGACPSSSFPWRRPYIASDAIGLVSNLAGRAMAPYYRWRPKGSKSVFTGQKVLNGGAAYWYSGRVQHKQKMSTHRNS